MSFLLSRRPLTLLTRFIASARYSTMSAAPTPEAGPSHAPSPRSMEEATGLQMTEESGMAGKKRKLHGYEFYRSIGSPKFVVAPMVDQSELAWRILSRSPLPPSLLTSPTTPSDLQQGAAHLCYTPMINAKLFADGDQGETTKYMEANFNQELEEEGSNAILADFNVSDRPLIVQFCANDPEQLLRAALKIQHRCDAIDINLGCPQHIARRGRYGSFLQDEWELIASMISTLHANLSIPVTAKFRIFPSLERTIAYAQMMEQAGASILTCHGRTREMKGHNTGLADWEYIKAVKQAVNVPVFANGNILYREDVDRCLEVTGCDGVMTAEGNLSNPALFLPADHPNAYPPSHVLASRYLDIVTSLRTPTGSSAIKAHLFRLMRPMLDKETDLRERLGRAGGVMDEFRAIVDEVAKRSEREIEQNPITEFPPPSDPVTRLKRLPVWAAQPYVRPLPITIAAAANGNKHQDAMSDLAAHGTGEERVAAEGSVSAPVQAQTVACQLCLNAAAQQCPRTACLIHCRALGRLEAEPETLKEDAIKMAMAGGLAGLGCEAHEAKYNKRKERLAEKRQNRAKGKRRKGDLDGPQGSPPPQDAKKQRTEKAQPLVDRLQD